MVPNQVPPPTCPACGSERVTKAHFNYILCEDCKHGTSVLSGKSKKRDEEVLQEQHDKMRFQFRTEDELKALRERK